MEQNLEDMSQAELTAYVQKLQEASSNVQAMKAIISKKKEKEISKRQQQINDTIQELLS